MRTYYTTVIKIVLCLLALPLQANATALSLEYPNQFYDAHQFVSYLQDPLSELSFEDVEMLPDSAFSPPSKGQFSGGYSSSTYWIKLPLLFKVPEQYRDQSHDWILEIDYAAVDYVDIYYRVGESLTHLLAGDRRPQSVRRAPDNFHAFYLRIPPNIVQNVYIKVRTSSSLQIPLNIWSPAGIYEARKVTQLGYGLYVGVLFIMAAYNLLLFFSLRERSYLYYVAYITCFCLLQTAIAGLNSQYLWPESAAWNNTSIPFFMGASCLFAVLFTRHFLATYSHSRNTDLFLTFSAIVCGLQLASSFFLSYEWALKIGNALTLFITLALIWTAALAVYKRYPGAQYFLFGWACLLIGSTIFMLVSSGVLPPNVFTENAARYGSAVEALLLALALGEKIKAFRADRNRAALNAREDLRAGNKELSMGLAQLEHNDQLKDEFLAKVSHELRTPLNGILGSLELMKLETLTAEVAEYAQSANISAEHMLELVNTLLSFSEAKGSLVENEADTIDLAALLQNLSSNFEQQLREKNLALAIQIEEEVPSQLIGDSGKLRLVLSQLLDNAIKFSSDGQVVLQVKPIKLSIHRSHIEFVMQDCGIGIAAENLSSIFDPFEQVSMSETQSGLGMGLAICKQLVNRMKGSISAEACERGARIRLQLPFQLPKDVPRAG